MPVILPQHPCPACATAHDLCDASPRTYTPTGVYAYTCPATHKLIHFRPFVAGLLLGLSLAALIEGLCFAGGS